MVTTSPHHTRTLWLIGALHAFTHLSSVILLPLYLPIVRDLKLSGENEATALVSVIMVSYFLPSYLMGVLADKVSRKGLLGWGLALNALGFIGLSQAPSYGWAIAACVLAGFGGSFFHPAATALIARLFPIGTGRALGRIGIGASVGFAIGPTYAGWRAEAAGWRQPVLEFGILGLVMAVAFWWLGESAPSVPKKSAAAAPASPLKLGSSQTRVPMFHGAVPWILFLFAALFFTLRDFAGFGMGSLGSLFLQHVHHFSLKETGLTLSGLFLASAISNPLFGSLSDKHRTGWIAFVLIAAAILVAVVPFVPPGSIVFVLLAYGFFLMASYPMVEAALMQVVPDAVRGRVFGLWITIGGLISNLSHWIIGTWVKSLGPAADVESSYYPAYGLLAAFVLVSIGGAFCLRALAKRQSP
jgi:MFS family permease